MAGVRQKFAAQIDVELLKLLRASAEAEGRTIQSVFEEALRRYLAESPQPSGLGARPRALSVEEAQRIAAARSAKAKPVLDYLRDK